MTNVTTVEMSLPLRPATAAGKQAGTRLNALWTVIRPALLQ